MTSTEYADTFVGRCPACNVEVPGHVFSHRAAGVSGWTCPECDTCHEPSDVEKVAEVDW